MENKVLWQGLDAQSSESVPECVRFLDVQSKLPLLVTLALLVYATSVGLKVLVCVVLRY